MTTRFAFDKLPALTLLAIACAAMEFAGSASAWAEEPDAADEAIRAERLTVMKQQAAEYSLVLAGSKTKLALHGEPILRFSNPVSGVPDGIIAMWKEAQRPAVFAQVFQTKEGLWIHEVQSLASAGLQMQAAEKVFWQPTAGAASFRALPDSKSPAATAGRRLVQMKALAEEFTAADDFKINPSDEETTRHELRLLPTPIYRYEDADDGVTDASVFAFVHGTDPELFLVLESRADTAGELSWHYALAPMTCWAVTVQHGEKTVSSFPERFSKSKPTDLYHVWVYRPAK